MPSPVDLEPQAKAVVDANANPPFLFELGPDQGRRTVDELQSGPVRKLTVDIEKHLRRAELKVAQANAWLAMARELAWQRDDYGGRAAR